MEFAVQVHKLLALYMSMCLQNLTTFTTDYATTMEGNNKYAQNSKYQKLDIFCFLSDFCKFRHISSDNTLLLTQFYVMGN